MILQPFVFGALHHRDHCYDSICEAGLTKCEEKWGDDHTYNNLPLGSTRQKGGGFIPTHFHPFTLAAVYEQSDEER